MERTATRSKASETDAINVEWPRLMEEALNLPGEVSSLYSRFYDYSMGNKILLFMQGVSEPVATYKRWQDMGRQVLKGSKAKSILRPIAYKETNALGQEESKVRGFKMVKCLFTVSETEGDPLPEYEPKEWSVDRALGALAIQRVAFNELNGNIQGMSRAREVAINPVAGYPLKTMVHEIAHVALGHTTSEGLDEYSKHRGVMEFQAESTAYLTLNEIGATDAMNLSESRGYIQTWLRNERPDDKAIKQVFTATDQILKAGRE